MNGLRRHQALLRALAIGLALSALTVAAGACGGSSKKTSATPTPQATTTGANATASAVASTPVHAGLLTPLAISPGDLLTHADLAARGVGTPGRGPFTGDKLIIPAVGINAPFSYKVVGSDGQMPNPNGPTDVAYYDFSQWPKAGGLPGKGGNIVLAGHVDYIHYGPAVFWRLHELKVGDLITIQMKDGTKYNYKVEFNKQVPANDTSVNWSDIVNATADESVTLITCSGQFEAGHYDHRQIVWGRRV
ncbi:MAG TPA: class F sortase [Dehalococcoidia bacterium]|nr:class F sortase [Dehalococcoidia bacterium]